MSQRIVAFAHDPGGANAVACTVAALRSAGFTVAAYVKGPARAQFERLNVSCEEVDDISALESTVAKCRLVVTGSSETDRTEVLLSVMAREHKVPSVVVLDYWANYRMRFLLQRDGVEQLVLPDAITAIDDVCAAEMIADGLPVERIHVTGQPYFSWLCERSVVPRSVPGEAKKIFFASQPHPAAQEVLNTLIELLSEKDHFSQLLVRFHPREGSLAASLENLEKSGISYSVDRSRDVLTTLSSCDCVVGLSSVILIEAALMGVPAASFVPSPWENSLKTNGYGLTIPVTGRDDLNSFLNSEVEQWRREDFCRMQEGAQGKIVELCHDLCSG